MFFHLFCLSGSALSDWHALMSPKVKLKRLKVWHLNTVPAGSVFTYTWPTHTHKHRRRWFPHAACPLLLRVLFNVERSTSRLLHLHNNNLLQMFRAIVFPVAREWRVEYKPKPLARMSVQQEPFTSGISLCFESLRFEVNTTGRTLLAPLCRCVESFSPFFPPIYSLMSSLWIHSFAPLPGSKWCQRGKTVRSKGLSLFYITGSCAATVLYAARSIWDEGERTAG